MIEQRFLQELGLDARVDSAQLLSGGDTALTYRVETDDLPLLVLFDILHQYDTINSYISMSLPLNGLCRPSVSSIGPES